MANLSEADAELNAILKQTQDKSWSNLLPEELNTLINSFLPAVSHDLRSKAYVVLSAVCQRLRDLHPPSKGALEAGTDAIAKALTPTTSTRLGDTGEIAVLSGLLFLAALFQVDWQAAAVILQHDGVVECVADCLDLFPQSLPIARAVAQLVSQAAGHKSCRALIPSQCIQWLEQKSRHAEDTTLRAAVTVALVKISKGSDADAIGSGLAEKASSSIRDQDLVRLMQSLVVSGLEDSSLGDAVEGLAYLSSDPQIKEMLSKDEQFLKRLISVIPRKKSISSHPSSNVYASPVYGTVIIISNLVAYRPQLTEEEAQIAKLKRMASAEGKGEEKPNPIEDTEHVKARGKLLIRAGALDALVAAVRIIDSRASRLAVGKAFLSLVEDQSNRGKVLQAGGVKALLTIIQGILPSSKKDDQLLQLDRSDMEPIQALAKLSITASPVQVFGPNEGMLIDSIRPFSIMLQHSSSSLLQRFEAMMALTNLSSHNPEAATRVANADGLMNKVELLMLEEHNLVRRAATELVCNLVAGSEEIFNKYGGAEGPSSKSKLHVLLALCDVDDIPTRLAAAGAVATLTGSPDACRMLLELEREKHRVLAILGQLIDPEIKPVHDKSEDGEEEIGLESDPGLVHRGVVCVRNFFVGLDPDARAELGANAQRIGLARALVEIFRGSASSPSNPIARPAAEALQALLQSGVTLNVS